MKVLSHNAHPDLKRVPPGLCNVVMNVLTLLGNPQDEITIILCDDNQARKLNRKFFNHNRTTDVISFNLSDSPDDPVAGEIYVNVDRARHQALEFDVTFWNELIRLTVHGMLHLYGFDDQDSSSRNAMISKQEELIRKYQRSLHC
jgi:probable rRNA maturation factor